ncbi:MAG: ComEC/Rec2 family competence protein, partial [Desulfocapsaceae bacterium]
MATSLFWYCRKNSTALVLLAICFLIFGLARSQIETQSELDENHIARQITQKTDAVIVGTLSRLVEQSDELSKAEIQVAFLLYDESNAFTRTTGTVLLSLQGQWPSHILPGDALAVRILLKPPGAVNTPGTFDYPNYLALKNIYLTGNVRS